MPSTATPTHARGGDNTACVPARVYVASQEPQIAVINGMVKDHMTELSDAEYRSNVRKLGEEYLETLPRRIANCEDD
jgi:hypothetical protein